MTPVDADEKVYLRSYLAPLASLLSQPDVTDIYVNAPGDVWIETLGGAVERQTVASLTGPVLDRLARQIAAYSHQGISREHPLLSASLPGGERIQIVLPPATRGDVALAIRKHVSADLTLADYVATGAFETLKPHSKTAESIEARLRKLQAESDHAGLLSAAVRGRCNIVVAGGTSTGKTTFLSALLGEIPKTERLILIEDTPEIRLRHPNAVGLLAARSELGEALVTAEKLLNASLRMRPDRIILGELRGPEAFTFLRAINTGHPGSMTTVHADNPARAIEQIALLVLQGGSRLSRSDVTDYIRSTIDVFVQLTREGGRRAISEVKLRGDV